MLAFQPEMDGVFAVNMIASPFFWKMIESNLKGIAYKGLNLSILRELPIPFPPISEQKRIVAKVNEILALCDILEVDIRKLRGTQLNVANTMCASLFGRSTIIKLNDKEEKKAMKIATELSLGSVEYDKTAILARLVGNNGADAKTVWGKSKLNLPEFYRQLKLEIKAGFIAKPAKAEFEG